MKRFLAFAGHRQHPDGGWNDLVGAYDSREEAEKALLVEYEKMRWNAAGYWLQLVDTQTMTAQNLRAEYDIGNNISVLRSF
jgi:hypothetical protein